MTMMDGFIEWRFGLLLPSLPLLATSFFHTMLGGLLGWNGNGVIFIFGVAREDGECHG